MEKYLKENLQKYRMKLPLSKRGLTRKINKYLKAKTLLLMLAQETG